MALHLLGSSMKNFIYITLFIFITSCDSGMRSFEKIKKSKTLKVITINSETTRYEDRDGTIKGFEHDLVQSFAEHENLKVKYIVRNSVSQALDDLKLGKGDFVAAGISITKSREEVFLFGPEYHKTQQNLVCGPTINPKNLNELQKYEIVVGAQTSYAQRLKKLQEEYQGLSWEEVQSKTGPELIQAVAKGEYQCTVADEEIVQIYRRYFPDINVPMKLGSEESIAWALPSEATQLKEKMQTWFKTIRKNKLPSLKENYFSFVKDFDSYDLKKFRKRIKTRLPAYEVHLKKAAAQFGWSWTLLAAIAYQESHWDPKSISPTGVRGFMMLTLSTAKYMGVKNRLDPVQSIWGGAKYLNHLEKRIPSYITGTNRKWMTLAAYNVGFAHLRDARGVAAWKNKNPNSWSGVKKVLPLLSSRKIYKRLPHGYARGLEPVLYVNRIRNYYNILKRSKLYANKR